MWKHIDTERPYWKDRGANSRDLPVSKIRTHTVIYRGLNTHGRTGIPRTAGIPRFSQTAKWVACPATMIQVTSIALINEPTYMWPVFRKK